MKLVDALDPRRLVARQLELDRERTRRFPELQARKLARMSASPLAFLRGAAPLFYEILQARGELALGPEAEGWLVGDAHLENFGAYSPNPGGESAPSGKHAAVFNLNDFDEAVPGPWRWDVLRLATSLILAGRELGVDGVRTLSLCATLIETYVASAFDGAPLPPTPRPVSALVLQVQSRSKKDLLAARTVIVNGQRKFARGPRYQELPTDVARRVPEALETYRMRLPEAGRPTPEQLSLVDCALRIAGTGSLGALRVAALTRGKGGPDGGWIFDMKEQFAPSAGLLLAGELPAPADRVEIAFRACVECPPRMLATSKLGSTGLLVRRLAPQEDKLNLRQLKEVDLPPLAAYLGALLGLAHVRGRARPPGPTWSKAEQAQLLDHAVTLAGLHEAIYLALCLRLREPL
ncbi:MAG TPA: DUF2252 family protein [Polyangiaceae bacterium]|nr:DUF2252 family protein [Polyangiaceae bacterium]